MTKYVVIDGVIVRYWYDRAMRSWTAQAVTAASDDGDQIGESQYAYGRSDLANALQDAARQAA